MDFAKLRDNFNALNERIERACIKGSRKPDEVKIVVVTKTHPIEVAQAVLALGVKDIGENRVQEIIQKKPLLTGDFSMHMIGHLQTNKVPKVLPLVDWIQSIDSIRLIEKIDQCKSEQKIKALVEVNTSGEASKSGCSPDACLSIIERMSASPMLEFKGLMTIGPLNGSESAVRKSFELLRTLGQQGQKYASRLELSMGMSSDFEWAIEEGATIIRVGSLLLGYRLEAALPNIH